MANLTIKGLPGPIHRELKQAAAKQGSSLNRYIVRLLERTAEETARQREMRKNWERLDALVNSLPPVEDSAELIREDRDHGH